jgi:hypothetical protein
MGGGGSTDGHGFSQMFLSKAPALDPETNAAGVVLLELKP